MYINNVKKIKKNSKKNKMDSEYLNLQDLPYDILLNILTRLDSKDLITLSQVNKSFNYLLNDNLLWKIKLFKDIHKWRMIDSKTWPKDIIINKDNILFDERTNVNYKHIYLKCNPDIVIKNDILKKLKSFQHIQTTWHATSTSDNLPTTSTTSNNNLTLSSLSSFAMPLNVYGQLKDFVYRNVFNIPFNENQKMNDFVPKLIMFGPGLETSTSCLVTNILWKSEFKTIGMIPGKDGYGSGIKLKLYNHKPFNLTILYTNVSTIRNSNNHELNANCLLKKNSDSYEINPQVREACSDADGFIYVIDNNSKELTSQNTNNNYKTELNVLMKESKQDLPLLILSLKTDSEPTNNKNLSCAQIVQFLELNKLDREWQIRDGLIFEPKMKGITLGFEWILNELDQKYFNQK